MTGRCTRKERWLPGSGGRLKVQKWNLHSFQLLRDNSSFGLNILGPLCLWQCLEILIGQFGDHDCRDFDIDPSNGVM